MSKNETPLELEVESDGVIRLLMLERQHGTSTEKVDDLETMESDADGTIQSRLGNPHR